MNCRETRPLLPLFFDGELEARQMRTVALHSTRCAACETDLRRLERLQDALAARISSQLDEIDVSRIWDGVTARIDVVPLPRPQRWREWWEGEHSGWLGKVPAYAALAAAALLAIFLWQHNGMKPPAELAEVDNSAILDSVQSNVGSLAVLREPETNTLVLWITDDTALSSDFGDLP